MPPAGASERPQTAVELKEQIEMERLGAPLLVYRDGADVQRILVVEGERGSIWIGRSDAADVSLPADGEVSGLHAQVEFVGSECTLLDDGISRNGTFVNEERVSGRRRLRDGDVIRTGQTRIRYRVPVEAAPEATVVADEGIAGATAVSPPSAASSSPSAALSRRGRRSRPRRPTPRSRRTSISASTPSRRTCEPSSRSSSSATSRRVASGWRSSSAPCRAA